MSFARVLVVNNEPMNLEIIGEYLSDSDYQPEMVESGEAAWAALSDEQHGFDLILLDRMMPGLDGIELLRRIKSEPRLRELPVIMQTAAATPNQVREGLQSGAHYYLTKPFEQGTLLAIMRSALDELRNRRDLADRIHAQRSAIALVRRGTYEVRTLEEAQILAGYLAQICPEPETAAMGLSELIINGIEHGNLGITYAEKSRLKQEDGWSEEIARRLALEENAAKRVIVDLSRDSEALSFRITDQGQGFDWDRYLEFDPERAFDPNGRGIALARSLAFASVNYLGNGNIVEAAISLGDDRG